MTTDVTITSKRIVIPVGRVLLGTAALAAGAGETGLNWQAAAAAGWDSLAICQLAAPWLALATVLGIEHSSGNLGWARRLGLWLAVLQIVGVVMIGSMHRTAAAQDGDLTIGQQAEDRATDLRRQAKTKAALAAEYRKVEAAQRATRCLTECAKAQAAAAAAEADAARLEEQASHLGHTKDGLALAHEARTLHIDLETYILYKPLALPIALQLIALFCGSVAFAPSARAKLKQPRPAEPATAPAPSAEIERISRVLLELLRAGGQVESLTALADSMGVHRSTISRASIRLEASGQADRHRHGRRVSLRARAA